MPGNQGPGGSRAIWLVAVLGVITAGAGLYYFVLARHHPTQANPPATTSSTPNSPPPAPPNGGGGDNPRSAPPMPVVVQGLDYQQPIRLLGHKPGVPIVSVAYSPDGGRLASYSAEGEVILWDLRTRSGVIVTPGVSKGDAEERGPGDQGHYGSHVQFSSDGKTLFSGSFGQVQLWDGETGVGKGVIGTNTENKQEEFILSPDGRTLITALKEEGKEGWQIWDAEKAVPLMPPIPIPDGTAGGAYFRFSPDSRTLAMLPPTVVRNVFGVRKSSRVFDLVQHRELAPVVEEAEDLVFLTDNTLGVWTKDKYSVWDLENRTGRAKLVSRGVFEGPLRDVTTGDKLVSHDRKRMLVVGTGKIARICEFATWKMGTKIAGMGLPAIFTEDNRTLIAAAINPVGTYPTPTVVEVDVASGQTRSVLKLPYEGRAGKSWEFALTVHPKRSDFLTAGLPDGSIVLHPLTGETAGLREVASLPFVHHDQNQKPMQAFSSDEKPRLVFSDDGKYLFGIAARNAVWDVAARKLITRDDSGDKGGFTRQATQRYSSVMVLPGQDTVLSLNQYKRRFCRYSLRDGLLQEEQAADAQFKPHPLYWEWRLGPDGRTAAAILATGIEFRDDTARFVLIDPATLSGQQEPKPLKQLAEGKSRDFRGITFSPDGQLVAVIDKNQVRLFELPSGRERPTTATAGGGTRIAFVEGGAAFVCIPFIYAGKLAVFEVASGQKLRELDVKHLQNTAVLNVAFSPQLPYSACLNQQGDVLLHDLKTGQLLLRHHAHAANPSIDDGAIALSPDGKLMVTWATDGVLKFWDAANVTPARPLGSPQIVRVNPGDVAVRPAPPGAAPGASRSREAMALAAREVSSFADSYQNWGRLERVPLAITPGGKLVAAISGQESGAMRLWDPATGKESDPWRGELDYRTLAITATPSGSALVGNKLEVFDLARREAVAAPEGLTPETVVVSPDGNTVAVGVAAPENGTAKLLRLFDLPSLKLRGEAVESEGELASLAYSADGSRLAAVVCAAGAYRVLLLDPNTGSVLRTVDQVQMGEADYLLALSADGKNLALAVNGNSPSISHWDLASGRKRVLAAGPRKCGRLAFIEHGTALVAAHSDIVVYDVATGALTRRWRVMSDVDPEVESPFLCPGRNLAIHGHFNGEVAVWDLTRGSLVTKFRAHNGGLIGLAISADEGHVVTAGRDDKVKVWTLDGK